MTDDTQTAADRPAMLSLSIAKPTNGALPATAVLYLEVAGVGILTVDLNADDFTKLLGGTVLNCRASVSLEEPLVPAAAERSTAGGAE